MPQNKAAYLVEPKAARLEIRDAPYPTPKDNEIIVQNHAVAINPIDWILQANGSAMSFPWLKYPLILGSDVSGEVAAVGAKVTRFKAGDRVVGLASGADQKRNSNAEAGFQLYTVLLESATSKIPDNITFDTATVLPLGLSAAAAALFSEDQLNLRLPKAEAKVAERETVLIWGGASAVGANAIQLAVAAGYEVFTTASPRNHDLVKRLGAAQAFDYKSPSVVDDLAAALKDRTLAGALAIGPGAADSVFDVFPKVKGRKFVACTTFPVPTEPPKRFAMLATMYAFMSWSLSAWWKSKTRGFQFKFVMATNILHNNISKAVFNDYLQDALASGRYVPAPEAVVDGHGLEAIQHALDTQRKGVSAKKIVVTL